MAELAPQGALQAVLARRIVAASWRLERALRIEAELFAQNIRGTTSFGLAMIRDCNGARAFDTLLRYRGGTLRELWRALRTLKALQAEAAAEAAAQPEAAAAPSETEAAMPIEPKARRIPGESAPAPGPAPAPVPAAVSAEPAPLPVAATASAPVGPAPRQPPRGAPGGSGLAPRRIEPERRTNPGEAASMPGEIVRRVAARLEI